MLFNLLDILCGLNILLLRRRYLCSIWGVIVLVQLTFSSIIIRDTIISILSWYHFSIQVCIFFCCKIFLIYYQWGCKAFFIFLFWRVNSYNFPYWFMRIYWWRRGIFSISIVLEMHWICSISENLIFIAVGLCLIFKRINGFSEMLKFL